MSNINDITQSSANVPSKRLQDIELYPDQNNLNSKMKYLYSTKKITPGIYNNTLIRISNMDNAYLISPNYGLKVFSSENFSGDVLLDVYNNTNDSVIVSPLNLFHGNSCQVYYEISGSLTII